MLTLLVILICSLIANVSTVQAQNRYEVPCRADLYYEYLYVVKQQQGIKEKTGKNDGEVQKYAKKLNYPLRSSYCNLCLVYSWVVSAENLNIPLNEIPVPISGLARSSYNYAKRYGIKTKYIADIGDNFVLKHGSWQGHVGSIDSIGVKGWIYVNECNTSPDSRGSQSNGNGNFRRKRNYLMPTTRMTIMGLVGFKIK